jgi:hypothetical protein
MARSGRVARPIAETNAPSADIEALLDIRPVTLEFKAMHSTADARLFDSFLQALSDAEIDLTKIAGHIPTAPPQTEHATIAARVAHLLASDLDPGDIPIGEGSIRRRRTEDEGLWGPASKTDRDRLLERIGSPKYRKQLREATGPTVLFVRSQTALLGARAVVVRDWLYEVSSALTEAPELSAVLLVEDAGARLGYQTARNIRLLVGLDPEYRAPRCLVLVSNVRARVPLTSVELDALVSPSMLW